jgi:ANTAR domain/GAF domain
MDASHDDSDSAHPEVEYPDSDHPKSDGTDRGPASAEPADVLAETGGGFNEHDDGSLDAQALQRLLLTTDTVQEFLDQLVQRAAASTGHHCGITVGPSDARDGAFTVACSDELCLELDEVQYANGNGPCLESLRTAVPVFVTDLAEDTRWPGYRQRALDIGARSSISYPLLTDGSSIGAINFYAFEPMSPRIDLQARASELAATAAGALALAIRLAERSDMIAHLRAALTSRSIIDQAIGVLMAQQRCGARSAFDILRKASQSRNVKLRDVAAGIVASVERGSPGATPGRY